MLERLAFTLLCLAKYNATRHVGSYWVNLDFKDIFSLARVTCKKDERAKKIRELLTLGYIGMAKQVDNLQNYAVANKMPFLIAIFWAKFDYWTHVSIKNFEHKKHTFKISFENAFANDLSHIFGDLTYFLNKKIYRKTLFELNEKRRWLDMKNMAK